MTRPPFLRPVWWRRLALALGGLLLLWGLAWLALPPLLKSQAEQRGSALLGRQLTIGAVDFKPWTLELTVSDLAVATADGRMAQLAIRRIYVDAELQSVLRMAPVLDAITLEAPHLRLTYLGGGHYDIDDLLERLKAPAGQAEPAASAPMRFALYNLTLKDGEADFYDQAARGSPARKHELRALNLTVPFLSNLEATRDVTVDPHLAFALNGSAFDSTAAGTPFASNRQGEANLQVAHFDLAPYLAYLPAGLPVQLRGAVLDADVRLAFVQTPKPVLRLSGKVQVSALKVADAAGAELLAVDSIRTELADVRPLEQSVKLASLEVTAPRLQAARGRAKATPATVSDKPAVAAASPWTLELARFALHQGELSWSDARTPQPARLTLTGLELQAQAVRWPFAADAATFGGSFSVPWQDKPARVVFDGAGTDRQGSVHATLNDVALGLAAPYVAQWLVPGVAGVLDADMDASWQGENVQLAARRLTVKDFALRNKQDGADLPHFKLLELSGLQLDLAGRTASVGKTVLRSPGAAVSRDAQGQWMFTRWLKAGPVQPGTPQPEPDTGWRVNLADVVLRDGRLQLEDLSLAKPVRLDVSGVAVQLKNLALSGKRPMPVSLSALVRSGNTEPGSVRYQGTVMWAPLVVQGKLDVRDIPAHALAPYFADRLNVELLRADASFKGQLRYAQTPAGAEVQVGGDVALDDFRANSVSSGQGDLRINEEELLSWRSLNLPGLALNMAPNAATRVEVREAALTDFFARVIVRPTGRLNLQDLVKPARVAADTPPPAAAAAAADVAPVAADPLAAQIQVGPVSLVNGRVLFSDRFIQPNYSADLSALTGKLSRFSSQPVNGVVQLADLDVRGRAEGTASLEISGKVNPLARPVALDIKGRVRDLELPPLSPYAIKYAGYGIERGKLSVDVGYSVKPDGQLVASNNIVLNQLTFGDKVAGAPNSLPVKLAVALLADRDGVIDIDLPISGSVNDPQFKLGAVVWKVITNLIVKAITAPFSLLASAFGGAGGDELSAVHFPPGSSVLAPAATQGLDKVAKALAERPALKMTVVGSASLAQEREPLKRERLQGMVLAQKRRRAVLDGQDAAAVQAVSAAEYPVLLKEVYKRADITKPRNLLGLAKDLPAPEMEALLLAGISVNEEAMRELALQRGVVVKDYLASRQLPPERLFLGAVRTANPEADWQPRAELNLSTR